MLSCTSGDLSYLDSLAFLAASWQVGKARKPAKTDSPWEALAVTTGKSSLTLNTEWSFSYTGDSCSVFIHSLMLSL